MAALLFKYDTAINIACAETDTVHFRMHLTAFVTLLHLHESPIAVHIREDGACFNRPSNVNLLIICRCQLRTMENGTRLQYIAWG